jgi:hypothetical protein
MKPTTPVPEALRQRLRQQWLQQAEAAFDLLFDATEQEHLVTFTQREQRAAALGKELAAWLLEQHLADDPAVRPPSETPPPCPKCGQPGQRLTTPDQPLPQRQLFCAAGEVLLRREEWRCKTCRVSFFPSGSQTAVGDGGL